MNMNKIRVFIFSKQSIFRQGLENSLSVVDDMETSGAAEINDEILSFMDSLLPDVAIIDIDAPEDNNLKMTRKLKQHLPNVGVIVLTSNNNDVQIFEALKAQAAACLNKEVTAEQLVETIRRVARGEHPINETLITHPILADQVLIQFQELSRQAENQSVLSPLTPREMEILNCIARGLLNKQIAAQLGISEQTIKNHVTSILRKLNANARTEAVVLAVKQGLITIK
jgi:DNA-binding NarL/FixJ family response regulator